jgi:hypothetical protein
MKNSLNGHGQGQPCQDGNDDEHHVSRRRFLQISGGATAVAAAGGAFYFFSDDRSDLQPDSSNSNITQRKTARASAPRVQSVTPEEAARLRHLRHRRQLVDGVFDTPFGPHEACEHDCTGALFAHEYERRN